MKKSQGYPIQPAIRPALATDAESIRSIQAATWIDTYPNHALGITPETLRRYMEGANGEKIVVRRNRFLREINSMDEKHHSFVGLLSETVVGYISASITPRGNRVIGALYVLPEYHGRGVGGLLLEYILDWYGREQDVTLNVAEYNTLAIQFYKRHGFSFSNRPGSDQSAEIAQGIRLPEREMVHFGLRFNQKR
jgi:GNAT superfamily N-acetyltransferase